MSADGSHQPGAAQTPARVSVWYIAAIVSFSLGTSAVLVCLAQALQKTLVPFGASTFLVGLLTSLLSLHQIWASPYATWKSDRIWTRFGRRKPLVLTFGPVVLVSVLLIPWCRSLPVLCLLAFILAVAASTQICLITPAIGDSVPDRQRPLATAMWQFTANGLGNFLMGRYVLGLMDPGPHRLDLRLGAHPIVSLGVQGAGHWPYTIAAVVFSITSLVFLCVMRETHVPPRPADKFRLFSYGRQIIQVREHLLIYLVLLFQPLFVLVGSWYFLPLATTNLGLNLTQFGNAFAWGALTTMVVCVPLGFFFNHVRYRREFSIAACLLALVPTTYGLFFMKTQTGMAFFFAAQMFAFSIFRLNFIPYAIEYTTPKSVGTVMGVTWAVNGIARFALVPFFGLLVDLAGKNYRLPLWGGYVGIAVCIACLLAMRPPDKVRHLIDREESEGTREPGSAPILKS